MTFVLITLAMVALIAIVLVLVSRAYPGSGADLIATRPARGIETDAGLEDDDIRQMIDAQNAYRRKRGEAEVTAAEAVRMAAEDERVRARGSIDAESLAELDRRMRERRGGSRGADG